MARYPVPPFPDPGRGHGQDPRETALKRQDLEHIIRAAADITGRQRLVVIGSQAILGQFPNAPDKLLISLEADIYAPDSPQSYDLITGAIREGSDFERTFTYFADGVSPTTATLPRGWEDRLIPICNDNTRGATGWCLEVHDIAIAKHVANREKDNRYNRSLWNHGLINARTLLCNREGCPVAVEVFDGNTADPHTVGVHIEKLRQRFALSRVVLVGDRGMLAEARIREEVAPARLDWISALRTPAIRELMSSGAVQRSMFGETDLAEVHCDAYPGERLIVCRNERLAQE